MSRYAWHCNDPDCDVHGTGDESMARIAERHGNDYSHSTSVVTTPEGNR